MAEYGRRPKILHKNVSAAYVTTMAGIITNCLWHLSKKKKNVASFLLSSHLTTLHCLLKIEKFGQTLVYKRWLVCRIMTNSN